MKAGELDQRLGSMRFEFLIRTGNEPNLVLVPRAMARKFIDGVTVDMGASVNPKLMLDSLEKDRGELVIHGMTVRLSKTADDVTVMYDPDEAERLESHDA